MLLLDWVFFEWKLCQKDSSNKVKLNSLFSKSIKENIKSIINFKKIIITNNSSIFLINWNNKFRCVIN